MEFVSFGGVGLFDMQYQCPTRVLFSAEQMLEELRAIILLQGDYKWLTSGRSAAENFVGFEIPENEDCLSLMSSAKYKMDMKNFLIASSFDDAHAFAFYPCEGTELENGDLHRLRAFLSNTPRVRIYPLLEKQPLHSRVPSKLCQTTVDVAIARWKLEIEMHGNFTLRELALLANVERREIMADVRHGRLNAITHPRIVTVVFDEAKRWLLAQPAFQSATRVSVT